MAQNAFLTCHVKTNHHAKHWSSLISVIQLASLLDFSQRRMPVPHTCHMKRKLDEVWNVTMWDLTVSLEPDCVNSCSCYQPLICIAKTWFIYSLPILIDLTTTLNNIHSLNSRWDGVHAHANTGRGELPERIWMVADVGGEEGTSHSDTVNIHLKSPCI